MLKKNLVKLGVFTLIIIWFLLGVREAYAAVGVQHNWAWGLDSVASSTMQTRSNTGNDVKIAIKVGASHGSDMDPILRLQIVNSAALNSGNTLQLYFTDCTGGVLKTCAARSIGTDPATQWVLVEKQGGTTTGLFRMREADNASVVSGAQHSGLVGVTEHNPTAGAWAEGSTSSPNTTASFTSSSWPAHDFSFKYYGSAPTQLKNYIFAAGYNSTLPSWSGMHSSTGALLDIIPANWTGSAIAQQGAAITGTTTATVTHIFADDSDTDSTTTVSYSTTESGTYTTPAGCDAITGGYNAATLQDGTSAHKRTCDITGLSANTIYFFKVTHTDADGVSGSSTKLLGPFYTDQTKAAVHMHAATKDANDTSTDDEGDLKEDDAGTFATSVTAGDGQFTLQRTIGRMQVDSFTPIIPANATLNSVELRYQWAMSNTPETAQKLYIASAGTEPALCASDGSGGTNWNLLETLPNSSSDWIAERSVALSGYTLSQLETVDVCLSNTNNSGSAASDAVGFDFLTIIPVFTPPASGAGAPTAVTDEANNTTPTQTQLNATLNTQGISGLAYFEYGTTGSYGSYSPDSTGEYIYNSVFDHGIADQAYFRTITGLTGGTLYHYRVCLKAPPTATAICGADQTVTTSASVSISITSDGVITYGTLPVGTSQDTTPTTGYNDTQTAKNNGGVTENFNIKTSNATGGTQWTLGAAPGTDVFAHEFSTNGGTGWTAFTTADSYQTLATGITANSTQNFDLRITVPTTSSDYQQKTITVTVQAVAQ
ncbi:MAG: hypothetical protein Q7S44_00380 [bacterium]|nr:hypothetical protein [bacterium]